MFALVLIAASIIDRVYFLHASDSVYKPVACYEWSDGCGPGPYKDGKWVLWRTHSLSLIEGSNHWQISAIHRIKESKGKDRGGIYFWQENGEISFR